MYFGASSRKYYFESNGWSDPAYDTSNGSTHAVPSIITQLLGNELSLVKEVSAVYIGASVATVDLNYYSTGANCQVKLYWYLSTDGQITGTGTTDTNAVWVNTNQDGLISLPRVAFRGLALEVRLVGLDGVKPPGQLVISTIEPTVYTTNTEIKL
jgi:hypothetical protein